VHEALVLACAARSDMVAVLGVPRHFDTAAVLAWRQRLSENTQPSQAGRIVMAPLSFAGFWHPWVRVMEPTTPALAPLREQPADGAVCGMIAARELARGVWVAPAGVPLRGPVGLARALSAHDTYGLFDAHANLLTARPGAISPSSAHTLATGPTLDQLSVRRLLILLRKVALIEGNRYVFATNTARFRQLVRLRFERLLSTLTRRGALAAYQIVADASVNTAEDGDQGRLIVVIRVAPTIPIEFITVSLVRAGEGLLDVVVG
jgi:phage tail sheath protein FI